MGANFAPGLVQGAGAAAQGYMGGRQARTVEDTSRQAMALRAAEEGRSKETHKVAMQQALLAIQDLQQRVGHNAAMNPMTERAAPGREVDPDYAARLGIEGFSGATREAENLAAMNAAQKRAATMAGLQRDKTQASQDIQYYKTQQSSVSNSVRAAEKSYQEAWDAEQANTKVAANRMGDPETVRNAKAQANALRVKRVKAERAYQAAKAEAAKWGLEFMDVAPGVRPGSKGSTQTSVSPISDESGLGDWDEED